MVTGKAVDKPRLAVVDDVGKLDVTPLETSASKIAAVGSMVETTRELMP